MLCGRGQFLGALSFIALVGLVGCSSSTPGTNSVVSRPFRGQEVELAVPKSLNLPAKWEVLIQEWSSQSGATARFVEYDATATISGKTLAETSPHSTTLLFPLKQLCEIDSFLAPLTAVGSEFDGRDLFKGLRERVLWRERQVIANPISVPVLVCYYRNDLLKAARRKAPETWDEYHELVTSLESWAPGLVAVEPLGPESRATTFFARSLAFCKHPENYSVWFDVDTAKPTLNTPGFAKALDTAQQTWSKLPPEVATFSPADCRRLMLTGKAAIALSFEPSEGDLSGTSPTDPSKAVQRIDGIELGICRIPGSRAVYNRNSKKWDTMPAKGVHAPALCGFAGLASGVILPPNHKGEVAGINLIVNLSSPETFDQAFATLPKSPSRESQLPQAPTWYGPELSTEEGSRYCDAVAQSLRDTQLVFELPLTGADEFRQAASAALEPLLQGTANAEQTMNTLQSSFETIVEKRGWEAVRDSHRRGLGLSPALKK